MSVKIGFANPVNLGSKDGKKTGLIRTSCAQQYQDDEIATR
jgi:hypothetical protein